MKFKVGDWVKLSDTWPCDEYKGAKKGIPITVYAVNKGGNFNIDTDECRNSAQMSCAPMYWDFVRRGPKKKFFK